jgi:hypothetical protein
MKRCYIYFGIIVFSLLCLGLYWTFCRKLGKDRTIANSPTSVSVNHDELRPILPLADDSIEKRSDYFLKKDFKKETELQTDLIFGRFLSDSFFSKSEVTAVQL